MIDFKGKRVLVTGGSRGIGAAVVRMMAAAGADVGFAYRSRESEANAMLGVLSQFGVRSFAFSGDLATRVANDEFVRRGVEMLGGVDIYIGNSGYWPPNPVNADALDDDRWRSTMATNLDGMFYGARAAARVLPAGGRLIFVSSTAGQRGEAGHSDYAASKGAMISFVKSLAVELGKRDITVNCVAPGWVDTEAVEQPFAGEGRARIEAAIPLGRVASPSDIAGPIMFLASPLARHVTGEVLNVNGGSVLCG
ncbi:MAG: SDR family NAD(P)-dependent oxidoreductase [Gemmatimonadota bacterium]